MINDNRCWDLYPEAKEMMRELNQKKVKALQEKWAAAIMMLSEEYTGARQKLLNAQQLYPELDNICLMLTICDILLLASSFRLSNNEIDFNCILDLIDPSPTYSDARYYLHNLVTLINGIKDEFPGAELAQEIVQKALLNMVSDTGKDFYHGFRHDEISARNPVKDIVNISDSSSNVNEKKLCVGELQSEGKFLEYRISAYDFNPGQVWAIYCGKDIMPGQYAVVNSVISNRQVCVTLLEPELVLDYENKWRENPPVACGTFKHGNGNVTLDMSQFSHLVKYVQGTTRPHYMIYPQKGEIWAMYKNWNRKWEHTDYEKCQCWVVEIISDFSKENGIKVAKLEEVHNCLTFFCRQQHEGFDLSCTVYEAEMLSFSHQIIAYRVPGIERYGIPKDSWHLEPRAIPHQQKV